MKNVLITGGDGFIGREIVKKITPFSNVTNVSRTNSQSLNDLGAITAEYLDSNNIDLIIHCAWEGLNDFQSKNHLEVAEKHKKFFEEIAKAKTVKEVIALGTCLEYGKVEGELFENQKCDPVTHYGEAKLKLYEFGEKLFNSKSINFKWFRIFYVYGENQKPSSLYPSLLKLKSENGTVFNMSSGVQIRDFIKVQDVASYIVELIDMPYSGVINCSSGRGISVYDFVLQNLEKFGLKEKVEISRGNLAIPEYEGMSFWGSNNLLIELLNKKRGIA